LVVVGLMATVPFRLSAEAVERLVVVVVVATGSRIKPEFKVVYI
jgi:hypothetical protein